MSGIHSLRSNFIYNFLNRIILILIPLITTPYVTRVLGSDELGLFSYANTIASYFVMLATMGLAMHGSRVIANVADDITELKTEYSTLRIIQIVNATVFFIGYIVYLLIFNSGDTKIATIQLLYVLSAVFDVTWFFSGIEQFKKISLRNVIINLTSTVCIFIFVRNENCLLIYTIIKVGAVLLGQISLLVSSIRYFNVKLIDKKMVVVHYKQMLVLFLPVAIESIFQSMDRVMLGSLSTFAAVGLYYSSRMVTDIPQCLVTSINTIMYPRIVSLKAGDDDEQASFLFDNSFFIINILCVALCFGISAVSLPFVSIFFGPDYYSCSRYIPLLTPYIALAAWNGTIRYQYLLPNHLDKVYIKAVLYGVVVNLGINLLLIPKYGVSGAIIATIIAELVTALFQTFPVHKEVRAFKQLKQIVPFLFFGFFMYYLIKQFDNYFDFGLIMRLSIEILIGFCIYSILSIIYLSVLKKELFEYMIKLIKRN